MDTQNIINSLNTVSEKLFKSIEGEVYSRIDNLINITPKIFKEQPLKEIFFQDKINILILIANSLILFYIIYFVILKIISIYNGNKSQSVYVFVLKLVVVGALVSASYYLCQEIINLVSFFTDCIDGGLKDISGQTISFENLKENILKIDDLMKADMLSLDGVIKGVISFGSISILINFAIRYVTIIFLVIVSPFAFASLSSELTLGIFKTWIKTLFVTLMVQVVVKFVIFIPLLYKDINSMTYKIILVGSIYIIYKINSFTKDIFIKITSDMPKANVFNS